MDPATGAALAKLSIDVGAYLSKGAINKALEISEKIQSKKALEEGLSRFLSSTANRCSAVKTMLSEQPVEFRTIYEPIGIKRRTKSSEESFFERDLLLHDDLHRVIITDTQGAGKSMFMRSLFLYAVEFYYPKSRFPIFCDLKNCNNLKSLSLNALVADALDPFLHEAAHSVATALIRTGNICLILDGFDEVDFDKRLEMISDIQKKSSIQKSKIFISSRENEQLRALNEFAVFEIDDIDLDKAKSIISRVPFDEDEKAEFINVLSDRLYDEYTSFATVPLLLVMMLITYSHYKTVPERVYEFYSQAFDTLFQRHDGNKPGLDRKRRSSFSRMEFRKVFSTFCENTYEDGVINFAYDELMTELRAAIEFDYEDRASEYEELFCDLEEVVCLLKKDGVTYTFSHRSFQEYFAAVFLSTESVTSDADEGEDEFEEIMDELAPRQRSDSVFEMLRDMNPDKFEKRWLIPKLQYFADSLDGLPPKELFGKLFSEMNIRIIEHLNKDDKFRVGFSFRDDIFALIFWKFLNTDELSAHLEYSESKSVKAHRKVAKAFVETRTKKRTDKKKVSTQLISVKVKENGQLEDPLAETLMMGTDGVYEFVADIRQRFSNDLEALSSKSRAKSKRLSERRKQRRKEKNV